MSKLIEDMINLQSDWKKLPCNWKKVARESREDFSLAYNMYEEEKASIGSLESKVFHYVNRVNYISAFCIMFQNLYRERKGYYDELIEYWGDEK